MRIKELIKELEKYDKNMVVEICIGEIKNEPILCVRPTMYNSRTVDGVVIYPKRTKEICLKQVRL